MRPPEGKMPGTPSPDPISTRRRRIAEKAALSGVAVAAWWSTGWTPESSRLPSSDSTCKGIRRLDLGLLESVFMVLSLWRC